MSAEIPESRAGRQDHCDCSGDEIPLTAGGRRLDLVTGPMQFVQAENAGRAFPPSPAFDPPTNPGLRNVSSDFPTRVNARASRRIFVAVMAALLLPSVCDAQAEPGRQQGPSPEQFREALETNLPTHPAAVLAFVGKTPILNADIHRKVEARIQSVIEKESRPIPEDQVQFARVNMTRGLLKQAIQFKMMKESFVLDQVATQAADKRDEAFNRMETKARQYFFDEQLPNLKKRYGTEDLAELERILAKNGSSLQAERRDFIDQMLGQLYMNSKIDREPTVPIGDIVVYYNEHRDEYFRQAEARWEQLTVLFERFSTREEARAAIAAMGSEAFYGGSMQAVAREKSQEPFASSGGAHDWTPKGSLRSKVLDQRIFSLPLNKMSEIIEDDEGLHIIRVLERHDAGAIPLAEVQDDIKKAMQAEIKREQEVELIKELSAKVPVWTIFPQDFPGAKPLPESYKVFR